MCSKEWEMPPANLSSVLVAVALLAACGAACGLLAPTRAESPASSIAGVEQHASWQGAHLSAREANSVRINGQRLVKAQLGDSDLTELGRTRFRFESLPA
jgi:hypothetical protein